MAYKEGDVVEFNHDRYIGEGYEKYPENEKFYKGQRGRIAIVHLASELADTEYIVVSGDKRILDVPHTSLDIVPEKRLIAEAVEERLRKAQEKKEFKDTEGRVGGSKKERRAYQLIRLSDLDKIEEDEATAIEMVKKDKVYPKVDIPAEQEKGSSAGAAYMKVKMREAFGGSPPNNKEKRKVYVGFADWLVKEFDKIITVDAFEKKTSDINDSALQKMIVIVNPSLEPEFELEEENRKSQIEALTSEIEDLKAREDQFEVEIREKYAQGLEYEKDTNPVTWDNVPESEAKKYFQFNEDIKQKRYALNHLHTDTVTSVEKEFLKKFGSADLIIRSSKRWIVNKLYEEIFGKRFANFMNKSSDTVHETYREARSFESLSEAESKNLIDKLTKRDLEKIQQWTDELAEVSTLHTREQLDEFFINKNHGSWGFSGGVFFHYGKGPFYYKDMKNAEMIELYRERFIQMTEKTIKNTQEAIEKLTEYYKPRANNWDWATGSGTVERKERSKITVNVGLPLSYIKRTGGLSITDDDVSVESIRQKFGFRQVEFGQSIKDTEAREHVRHFLGAIADMGEVLDLNVIKLNQWGGLSVAFASRGSGSFAAHYEPLRKIINITKSRGDGSIAHEYFHYIDDVLRMKDGIDYDISDRNKIHASHIVTGKIWRTTVKNIAVSQAIKDIMNYIYHLKVFGVVSSEKVFINEIIPAVNKRTGIPSRYPDENIEDYWKRFTARYTYYRYHHRFTKKDMDVLGSVVQLFGYANYEFTFESKQSRFLSYSSKMKSDYWTRDWELFARAFETYMYDKLAKAGRVNNYLVSGDMFDYPEQVYPTGNEREQLFILFDDLITAIKSAYDLAGFIPWTTQRTDEYIDFKDDTKKEIVEAGVIVPEPVHELSPADASGIKTKLKMLKELLSYQHMSVGGKMVEEGQYSDYLVEYFA